MNLFDLFSLNRHGDYQEILFSSALSYLLNPKSIEEAVTHKEQPGCGLKEPLDHFLRTIGLADHIDGSKHAKVTSEAKLGEELGEDLGKIDLLIELERYLIGVEVKIWDRSADNESKDGEHQLMRYARGLDALSKMPTNQKPWILVFVVPHFGAKICAKHFQIAYDNYPGCVKAIGLMPRPTTKGNSLFPVNGDVCDTSVAEIAGKILQDISSDNEEHLLAKRLVKDMQDFLLNDTENRLNRSNPEPGRFPSLEELESKCPNYYSILEPFRRYSKIRPIGPSTVHTTIGFSYERDENRSQLHGNCLYRIRTTRDYYSKLEEKEKYLPVGENGDWLDIELWPDVFERCKESMLKWIQETGAQLLPDERHIDESRRSKVLVVKFKRVLTEKEVTTFESILRDGFAIAAKDAQNPRR